ncbi:MAG TPA: DUF11 domain-containing protein [Chloroflexi bacterium]|nr:DUF11 domain-containing protein [Chloroflexota bacterium]
MPAPTSTPSPEEPTPAPSEQAKIRISKSADPVTALPGGQVLFTIQVCNEGDQAAENVVVSDVLPPELALVSASASQGVVVLEGDSVRAELGSLGAGACAEITIVARVRADVAPGVQIRNVASVGPLHDDADITITGLLPESGTSTPGRAFVGIWVLGVIVSALGLAWRVREERHGF